MNIDQIKRQYMVTKIIDILTVKTEIMTPDREKKIPVLAKLIEHMLYMSARTEDDYLNDKNIRDRIKFLLVGLG